MCRKLYIVTFVTCACLLCGTDPAVPVSESPESSAITQLISMRDVGCSVATKGKKETAALPGDFTYSGGDCDGAPRGCE